MNAIDARIGRPLAALIGLSLLAVAVVGGLHLYARSEVDATLRTVSRSVELDRLALLSDHRIGDAPDSVFEVVLKVANAGPEPMLVGMSDIVVILDGVGYDVLRDETSPVVIDAGSASLIMGNVRIPARTLEGLRTRGGLVLQVQGRVDASAQRFWTQGSVHELFSLEGAAVFD